MHKNILTLTLIMLLTATSLWAAHPGQGPEPDDCLKPMLKQLELSKTQRVQVDGIIKQYKDRLEANRSQTHAARAELHRATLAGKEDLVRTTYRKVATLQEENLVLRTRMLNEIKPYLNEAQLKQLHEPPIGHHRGWKSRQHHAQ